MRSVDTVRLVVARGVTEVLRAAASATPKNWIAFRCTQNFSGANVTIRWDSPTANTKQAVETLVLQGALG